MRRLDDGKVMLDKDPETANCVAGFALRTFLLIVIAGFVVMFGVLIVSQIQELGFGGAFDAAIADLKDDPTLFVLAVAILVLPRLWDFVRFVYRRIQEDRHA